jgi:transcriptional regulator with XRE-family HTH domain
MSIGARIKELRTSRGMGQADLARTVGLQPQSIWRIESGVTKDPGIEVVRAIAAALGCSLDDLASPSIEAPPEPTTAEG